jgi:3-hydroxybutyryl-CoA dehydrogenase
MSFNVPTDFSTRSVAVIGAGTLGRRIALMFVAHGSEVKIYDLAEANATSRSIT